MLVDRDMSACGFGGARYGPQEGNVYDLGMRVDQIPNEKFVDGDRLDDRDSGETELPQATGAKVKHLSRLP
jgi:hypothetical protein